MGAKEIGFEVVYRGEYYDYKIPGTWVFFQREKHYGGGFWLGQAFDDCYLFGLPWPVSLRQGMAYLSSLKPTVEPVIGSVDDFELTGE